jgi:hypothetical protein
MINLVVVNFILELKEFKNLRNDSNFLADYAIKPGLGQFVHAFL